VAILQIRRFGDPVLRQEAKRVGKITDDHRRLIADMFETMRDAPGVGLAAPQVGVLERIFVWEVEEEHGALINPVIIDRSQETITDEEGCLSLPGLVYQVERHGSVTVEARDENGEAVSVSGNELLARVFQHEIDHLGGVLFIDRIDEESRKEAKSILRAQALGLPVPAQPVPRDERL
jgi:peptide deformylase